MILIAIILSHPPHPRTVLCLEHHIVFHQVTIPKSFLYPNVSASSDERRLSRGDDGYISPPVSRRTSEATKLPSIHELAKDLNSTTPIAIPPNAPPPSKRDSLSTISSRTSSHHEPLPFPPEYPGATIAAITKARSNSYPTTMTSSTFPTPSLPPPTPSHGYPEDTHATPIARAIGLNHQMHRLLRDYEIVLSMTIWLLTYSYKIILDIYTISLHDLKKSYLKT